MAVPTRAVLLAGSVVRRFVRIRPGIALRRRHRLPFLQQRVPLRGIERQQCAEQDEGLVPLFGRHVAGLVEQHLHLRALGYEARGVAFREAVAGLAPAS